MFSRSGVTPPARRSGIDVDIFGYRAHTRCHRHLLRWHGLHRATRSEGCEKMHDQHSSGEARRRSPPAARPDLRFGAMVAKGYLARYQLRRNIPAYGDACTASNGAMQSVMSTSQMIRKSGRADAGCHQHDAGNGEGLRLDWSSFGRRLFEVSRGALWCDVKAVQPKSRHEICGVDSDRKACVQPIPRRSTPI